MREQGLTGAKNIGGKSPSLIPSHFVPLVWGRSIIFIILLIQVKGKIDHIPGFVVEGDVEVFGIHQFAHNAMHRRVEFLHILDGAGGIGDAIQGILHLLCPLVVHLARVQLGVTLTQGF